LAVEANAMSYEYKILHDLRIYDERSKDNLVL